MIIVFTSKGTDWDSVIDPRFGRTDYLCVYDEEKDEMTSIDNRDIANDAHGAGPKTAQLIFGVKPDVLITGNGPGGNAETVLKKLDLKILIKAGDMTLKEAYKAFKDNGLTEF